MTEIPRRTVLARTVALAAGAVLASRGLSGAAYAAPKPPAPAELREAIRKARAQNDRVMAGIKSRNGWGMEKVADDQGNILTRPVPGTSLSVQTRMGEVAAVLVYVVQRFHYGIDSLREGDVVGWRKPGAVRKGLAESNQASGTAVQIRPNSYPSGTRGGLYPLEEVTIRDILAECEGVVRWGGDDDKPDESLFYIDVPPGDERLTKVAEKIWHWAYTPGQGSGVLVDPLQSQRRKAAEQLAGKQA